MMKYLLLCLAVACSVTLYAQSTQQTPSLHTPDNDHRAITQMPADGDFFRCISHEYDLYQRDQDKAQSVQMFEEWMASKVATFDKSEAAAKSEEVYVIPTIFHIIHRATDFAPAEGSTNILAKYVNAQIKQLNEDFRQLNRSQSSNPFAADAHIEFCAALYDPDGNELAEPGINRINAATHNPPLGVGVYTIAEFDDLVKRNTYWNPDEYFNFWSADLGGGAILGYAQFPEAPCLDGIGTGNGGAETDGVVCLFSTVGGYDAPAPNAPFDLGRTGTHEVGHWLGLRHVWGDTDCGGDDFVDDTPNAADSNGGCPDMFPNTCDDSNNPVFGGTDPVDQMNNYMDYSNDACFDMFSNSQRVRMRIVMGDSDELTGGCAGSPRREVLRSSNKCQAPGDALYAEFVSFAATSEEHQVELNWEVSTEVDVRYYQVEHSTHLNHGFTTLDQVAATAKTGEGATYNAIDTKPVVGYNYYRLRIVDATGKYRFSSTITVKHESASFVTSVFPNPAKESVFIGLDQAASQVQVVVRDYLGQIVRTSFVNDGTTLRLNTSELSTGTYFVEINSNLGREVTRIVVAN